LLAAGEVSRAAYVLIAARQSPVIDREMRSAVESLLEFCQAALGKGAQQVAEAAKLHDAGSAVEAATRLRRLLSDWPANALAHYELALALVAQQYTQAGRKPPPRTRLSIHSEIPPGPAALDAYAKARAHDPLLIRAYQGGEPQGVDILLVLGKKVRPLWDQIARETDAKVGNDDLEALANALLEAGIAEVSLAVRQVLIGRERGYDEQDRKNVAAALRSLAPAAADPVVARLAAKKPEFVRVILP
jgi:tetratricopeptide (TPR) repeat protein